MIDYAWIISADRQPALGITGVSNSYIIPRVEINGFERKIVGNKIWIFLRGQQDRCIAAITVKKIERFSEGLNTGDFLIYTDLTRSIRLCSYYEDAKRYSIPSYGKLNIGLNLLDKNTVDFATSVISQAIETKFVQPTGLLRQRKKLHLKSDKEKALSAVSQVVESMNLNQIWGSGTGMRLNPVSNFAAFSLFDENISLSSELLTFLKTLNPIEAIISSAVLVHESQKDIATKSQPNFIDLSFTEIIPENIYAREFVSGENTLYNLDDALSKTDIAEKLHQSMLRDISNHLKSKGIIPYESTSIDLAIEMNSKTKMFEIKSTHNDNLVAQAAKGAFQIGSYIIAMKKEMESVHAALIISKISDEALEKFVLESLGYLNIDCLVYNSELPWPDRLPGLLD